MDLNGDSLEYVRPYYAYKDCVLSLVSSWMYGYTYDDCSELSELAVCPLNTSVS